MCGNIRPFVFVLCYRLMLYVVHLTVKALWLSVLNMTSKPRSLMRSVVVCVKTTPRLCVLINLVAYQLPLMDYLSVNICTYIYAVAVLTPATTAPLNNMNLSSLADCVLFNSSKASHISH